MTRQARATGYTIFGFVIAVAVVLGITLSRKSDQPAQSHHRQLTFDEEFDGSKLDTSKLVTCYDWFDVQYQGCTNGGNNELEWYTPKQVTVHGGSAWLTAIAKPATGTSKNITQAYPYQSGMISTGRTTYNGKPKHTFQYGYFEARVKVPAGQGLWPAFWLVPANHQWPPEIDIMEILGNAPGKVLMTYHYGAVTYPGVDETIYPYLSNPSGWHTYALDWQPGKLTWYIDGTVRKSVTSKNVPATPMELLLNLAVGGSLPGNPDASTHFPANMQIDYVRVYQRE